MAKHENHVTALLLSNLGEDFVENTTIRNFVELCLDQDNVRVKTYQELPGIALVILENQVDFYEAAERLQEEDDKVSVDKPELIDWAVVLSSVSCDAATIGLTEEVLETCLCDQFGDGKSIVLTCKMHWLSRNSFVAFVFFKEDLQVMNEMLKSEEHVLLPLDNYKIVVEPYYKEFHTLLEIKLRSGIMEGEGSRSAALEVKDQTEKGEVFDERDEEEKKEAGQSTDSDKMRTKKVIKSLPSMKESKALITKTYCEDRIEGMSKTQVKFLKHLASQSEDCRVFFEFRGEGDFHAVFRGSEDAVFERKMDFIKEMKKIKDSSILMSKPMTEILCRKLGYNAQRILASYTEDKGEISFSSTSINIVAFGDDNLSSCEEILRELTSGFISVAAPNYPEAEFRSMKDSLELDLQVFVSFEDSETIVIEGIKDDCERAAKRAKVKLGTFRENSLVCKEKILESSSPETDISVSPQSINMNLELPSLVAKSDSDSLIYQLGSSFTLEIKNQGNITQEDSTVLVNLLDKAADLRKTSVGKSFNSACPELWKKVEKAKKENKPGQILATAGPFVGLPSTCQFVYHVILHRYASGESETNLLEMVLSLVKRATKARQTSIAIPALGCGRAHGFPQHVVAHSVILGLQKSIGGSSLTKVVLLCGDERLLQAYKAEADKVFHTVDQRLTTPAVSSEPDSSPVEMSVGMPAEEVINEESPLYNGSHWSRECLSKIQGLAESRSVKVRIKDHASKDGNHKISFKVKGKKISVQEVLDHIAQVNRDILSKLPKCIAQSGAPQRDTLEFVKHAAQCEEDCPSYWNFFTNFKPNQSICHSKRQEFLVDISPKSAEKLAAFVLSLFDGELVGRGQDALGLSHSRIKINGIQRVENPGLFRRYSACRKLLFEKVAKQKNPCPNISKVKFSSGPLATYEHLPMFMRSELYSEINEHYLFHGTNVMETIVNNGPDWRVGSADGMLGRGFYMAERATKADQYADRRGQRTQHGTELTMILFRALLGNVFVCGQDHPSVQSKGLCR